MSTFPPSARLAALVELTQAGPYLIRVKVPSGVKLMPHRHPEDRVYTVMSDVFYIGLGDRLEGDKVKAYPPGSVIVLPGNTWHFHWAKSGEYVTQATAINPLPVYRLLEQGQCGPGLVRQSWSAILNPVLLRANVRRAIDAKFHSLKLHRRARSEWLGHRTFERVTIATSEVGRSTICAFQKGHEHRSWLVDSRTTSSGRRKFRASDQNMHSPATCASAKTFRDGIGKE
jgi:hypothetical protein